MDVLQVASAGGEDDESVLAGVRELPVTELRLLHRREEAHRARALASTLGTLGLAVTTRDVEGDFRSVFGALGDAARARSRGVEVYVNVSSGPRKLGSSALAACYFHGLRAFEIDHGKPAFMPILAISYPRLVGASKMRVLNAIASEPGRPAGLAAIAGALGMDKSLLSYHLRGNAQTTGLEGMGLVRIERAARGRLRLQLTPLGEFVLGAGT